MICSQTFRWATVLSSWFHVKCRWFFVYYDDWGK